jgi:GNAT superfamily N-acetyltransferase
VLAIRIARSDEEREQFRLLEREYDEALPADLRHDAHEALDEGSAVMKRLYVRPEYRGTGAGRALAQACVDLARERGYRRIVLDTNKKHLEAAYRLYRSMGFAECDPYAGVNYSCPTFMELVLP